MVGVVVVGAVVVGAVIGFVVGRIVVGVVVDREIVKKSVDGAVGVVGVVVSFAAIAGVVASLVAAVGVVVSLVAVVGVVVSLVAIVSVVVSLVAVVGVVAEGATGCASALGLAAITAEFELILRLNLLRMKDQNQEISTPFVSADSTLGLLSAGIDFALYANTVVMPSDVMVKMNTRSRMTFRLIFLFIFTSHWSNLNQWMRPHFRIEFESFCN